MKKFPIIEMREEENTIIEEEPEPEPEPELPKIKTKPEDIFVKKAEKPTAKASKASEKQLAHLETIRAKALLARQNKKKEKEKPVIVEQPQVEVEDTSKPPPIERSNGSAGVPPTLYTKSQMDDYAKSALVNYHTQERDKRIAEVRKKQAELEEQRKKYDVSSLLKKGGRNRMW